LVERHGLSLAKTVEGLVTGRRVEEVLAPIARRNKAKSFVTDEPFDRAIHRCHVVSSICVAMHADFETRCFEASINWAYAMREGESKLYRTAQPLFGRVERLKTREAPPQTAERRHLEGVYFSIASLRAR
jgi:hypothetical protein